MPPFHALPCLMRGLGCEAAMPFPIFPDGYDLLSKGTHSASPHKAEDLNYANPCICSVGTLLRHQVGRN